MRYLYRFIACIAVISAIAGMPLYAASQAGVAPYVHVKLWGDTSRFVRHLVTITPDVNGTKFLFDDGSTWQVKNVTNGVFADIDLWEIGDLIKIKPDPTSTPAEPRYLIANNNKNPSLSVQVKPVAFSQGLATYNLVAGIHISDPLKIASFLHVANNFAVITDFYGDVVANWTPGQKVLIDVVENSRVQEGTIIVYESLLVINPANWSHALVSPVPEVLESN